MSTTDNPGEAPDLSKVQYIEGTEDPNWWRTRVMTPEELAHHLELWNRYWMRFGDDSFTSSFKRLLEQGGGFSGRGVTDAEELDWPRRVILYVPPLKGYWSEKGKQSMLNTLEQIYRDIKSEIEHA